MPCVASLLELRQAKAAETWHPPEFSPSGAESPPQTSDVLVSAEELCLHAKQVAGDKDWKKVGFWIDKACGRVSDHPNNLRVFCLQNCLG